MRSHESMKRPLAGWLRVVIVSSAFPGILIWEIIRPLRREVDGKAHRLPRHLAVAGLGALTVHLAEAPVIDPLARHVHQRRIGLLPRLGFAGVAGNLRGRAAPRLHALPLARAHSSRAEPCGAFTWCTTLNSTSMHRRRCDSISGNWPIART